MTEDVSVVSRAVDAAHVTRWLSERCDVQPPLSFSLLAGGRSNLTFRVEDAAGRRWVLRRAPLHGLDASGHDMAREHRIQAALQGTPVPVAQVVGLDMDPRGAPYYVSEFVDGRVVRTAQEAEELPPAARRRAGESLVDVLVELHDLDPAAVGLGQLGRPDGYVERQLRRFHGQLTSGSAFDVPGLHRVHAKLAAAIPLQRETRLIHGDYKLANVMLEPATGVAAVLDWELSTQGDPLADVGLLAAYWPDKSRPPLIPSEAAPTRVPDMPGQAELLQRYATRSGRDLDRLPYYLAFAYWRLAIILQGVSVRFATGAYGSGGADPTLETYPAVVNDLADAAESLSARWS